VYAGRCERADLRGAQAHPRLEHDVTGAHVAAAFSNIGPDRNRITNLDRVPRVLDQLERDDRVSALGNRAPGRDGHGLSGRELPVGGRTRRDPGDDGETCTCAGVLRPDREPVHRRAREGREVDE
jgi:hypothetical protein